MAFFAIPIEDPLRRAITTSLEPWKNRLPSMQWTHPDDYHLTLRFVAGMMQAAPQPLRFAPFALELSGLGCFPPQRDRGILWVGLKSAPEPLLALQKALEEQVRALGFPPEHKPFAPHITVGRYTEADASLLFETRSQFEQHSWGSLTCAEYVLMKRRSGAKNHDPAPLYQVLARFPA